MSDDPVEQISQREELAAGVSEGTDWHGAHDVTQVHAQKCHKEKSYIEKMRNEKDWRNIVESILRFYNVKKERKKEGNC